MNQELSPADLPGLVPFTVHFLREVLELPAETKCRFMGYAIKIDLRTQIMTISDQKAQNPINVDVDFSHVPKSRFSYETGTWYNIVGYVRKVQPQSPDLPILQAVMIWKGGAMNIETYEKEVMEYRNALERTALLRQQGERETKLLAEEARTGKEGPR